MGFKQSQNTNGQKVMDTYEKVRVKWILTNNTTITLEVVYKNDEKYPILIPVCCEEGGNTQQLIDYWGKYCQNYTNIPDYDAVSHYTFHNRNITSITVCAEGQPELAEHLYRRMAKRCILSPRMITG